MQVVDDVQEREKRGNLREIIVVHCAVIEYGNMELLEQLNHLWRNGGYISKQNGDILILIRRLHFRTGFAGQEL